MNEYVVLIGEQGLKVIKTLTTEQLDALDISGRHSYWKDCSIDKKFYSGRVIVAEDPFSALVKMQEIEREESEEKSKE
jgi:hypothetical protein